MEVRKIKKRKGQLVDFDYGKIEMAIERAYNSVGQVFTIKDSVKSIIMEEINKLDTITVEKVQDIVERTLIKKNYEVGRAYIVYRSSHQEEREIDGNIEYMNNYMSKETNAATASNTDPNANMTLKNVANMEHEVYKKKNRKIQRRLITSYIQKLYSKKLADQYLKDLRNHIIYPHDEASSPAAKNYCEAVTLYPLQFGTSALDGTGTKEPDGLQSFCGQLINATFLLASQCKGAVAFGEFFNFFDHYAVRELGEDYHLRENEMYTAEGVKNKKTIGEFIESAFCRVVLNWNQPASNRGSQSPFVNISYYDKNYWKAMFSEFYFADGTQPSWERVDYLQRKFMKWFNKERTRTMLTFPVETMALLHDGKDVLDKDYKDFTAEMQHEGHSFFVYLSDNPDSLASCCRLSNQIKENTFSFTNGLTGVQTGSCNVITLNLSRITQDWFKNYTGKNERALSNIDIIRTNKAQESFINYLSEIVKRVHKYHIAYKTMLYDWEKSGMFTASNAGYISMSKLYSTVGLNGINEAAEFLGIKCSYNNDYRDFCELITGTISELNKEDSTKKFQFNTEFVPAEGLSSKNYKWDKNDGYWVPETRNLYNSYFYLASDENTDIVEKIRLHGKDFTSKLDGGVGLHGNLDDHLTKKQYLQLMDLAIKEGCKYYTFNIKNSECLSCGHIEKHTFSKCPVCGSTDVQDWSRVIGYLRPIPKYDADRFKEAQTRVYSKIDSNFDFSKE